MVTAVRVAVLWSSSSVISLRDSLVIRDSSPSSKVELLRDWMLVFY